MRTLHSRARRFLFTAPIELTDVESGAQVVAVTLDLSVFGCQVGKQTTFPIGTKVYVRISHRGTRFLTLGKVARVQPNATTGILFSKIEIKDQAILDGWLAETRDSIV